MNFSAHPRTCFIKSLIGWHIRLSYLKLWYLCIYVTRIKPNFHECFPADNGKNRNMPTKRLANQADDKIIQSICWQSYENSIIQAILNNMNLSLLSDKLQSVEKVMQFCQEKNLLAIFKSCRTCEHPCHLKKMRKSYAWRCRNTKCWTWTALREGTFFSRSKLAIAQILKFIYLWLHEMATVKNMRRERGINSVHTLTDWSSCILSTYTDSFRYRPGNARETSAISL